jgi:hypothetical protein
MTTTAFRQRPDGGTDMGCRTVGWERESWGAFSFLSLRYETTLDQFGVVEPASFSRRAVERTVDRTAAVLTAVALAAVWGCVAVLLRLELPGDGYSHQGEQSAPSAK